MFLTLPYRWTPHAVSELLHWMSGWPIWLDEGVSRTPPYRSDHLMTNQRVPLQPEGGAAAYPTTLGDRVAGELFVLDGTDLVVRDRREVFAVIEGDSTAPLLRMATGDVAKLTGIAQEIARTLADSQVTRLDRVRMFFTTADGGLAAEVAGRTSSGQRHVLRFMQDLPSPRDNPPANRPK